MTETAKTSRAPVVSRAAMPWAGKPGGVCLGVVFVGMVASILGVAGCSERPSKRAAKSDSIVLDLSTVRAADSNGPVRPAAAPPSVGGETGTLSFDDDTPKPARPPAKKSVAASARPASGASEEESTFPMLLPVPSKKDSPRPADVKPAHLIIPKTLAKTMPAFVQEAAPQPEKLKGADKVPELPAPRPFPGFGPNQIRLPLLDVPKGLGRTPQPTAQDLKEYSQFIEKFIDPRNTIELVQGRIRLMMLKEAPKRAQIGDESVAGYTIVGNKATEISLLGKSIGTTVFNLWFDDPAAKDKEKVLSFLIRVVPDPEARERLENVYKALEKEINTHFPDSVVHLKLLGDKLVVTGEAHDAIEAENIMRVVRANAPGGDGSSSGIQRIGGGANASKIPLGPELSSRPGDPGAEEGIPGLEDYQATVNANVINMLKIPGEQQVMLKVTVAEVNRAAARSIGVNFSIMNNQGTTVFNNRTGNIATGGAGAVSNAGLNVATAAAGLLTNNIPVALDNGQIALAINALRNLNYARSLAEPNLVTLNGQTANFQAGGEFPVPVVTGNTFSGLQGVRYIPFGVQLQFTPYITDKDRVRLNVQASVSTRDNQTGTQVGNSNVAGLNSRRFSTVVELREGQTLAVAGLIQNNIGADSVRIPFFGDLPVIGRFGAYDKLTAGEQELIVLITPELVHPMSPKEVPPLPGSDLFEPTDLEFYLCGRLESQKGRDYRSPVITDWSRLRRFHQFETNHVIGPSGYEQAPSAP